MKTAKHRWVVTYSRLPVPAVEFTNNNQAPGQGGQIFWDQPLSVTVFAYTQDEAVAAAQLQIDKQIKGGQYITSQGPIPLASARVGSPRIYTLKSVKRLP